MTAPALGSFDTVLTSSRLSVRLKRSSTAKSLQVQSSSSDVRSTRSLNTAIVASRMSRRSQRSARSVGPSAQHEAAPKQEQTPKKWTSMGVRVRTEIVGIAGWVANRKVLRRRFGRVKSITNVVTEVSSASETEVVPFSVAPVAEGAVEMWLLAMQQAMCETLYDNCKGCLVRLGEIVQHIDWAHPPDGALEGKTELPDLDSWYNSFPAQAVIMIGQIEWCTHDPRARTCLLPPSCRLP